MARRKTKTKYRYRAKPAGRRRPARRKTAGRKFTDFLIGGLIAVFISTMIPFGGLGKLAIGFFGHKKSGLVGTIAIVLAILGVMELAKTMNLGSFNLGGLGSSGVGGGESSL